MAAVHACFGWSHKRPPVRRVILRFRHPAARARHPVSRISRKLEGCAVSGEGAMANLGERCSGASMPKRSPAAAVIASEVCQSRAASVPSLLRHPTALSSRLFHCREFSGCSSAGRAMCQYSDTPESSGASELSWEPELSGKSLLTSECGRRSLVHIFCPLLRSNAAGNHDQNHHLGLVMFSN